MEAVQVLEYSNIFVPDSIENILKDIPSVCILEYISFYNAQLHSHEHNYAYQYRLIQHWIDVFPVADKLKILTETKRILDLGSQISFLNNVSFLKLIQYVIANFNTINYRVLDNLDKLSIFKAYLICNEEWTKQQESTIKNFTGVLDDSILKVIIPIQLPFQDLIEIKEFNIQMIKAVYFYEFAEKHPDFKQILNSLYKDRQISSWQEYLLNILNLYILNTKHEHNFFSSKIYISNEFQDALKWVNFLSINIEKFKSHNDFKGIREKPIFKLNENNFLILNQNFLVDKLFQGILFDFYMTVTKHKIKIEGNNIGNFNQFKSLYSEKFSEKVLFFRTMNYLFDKQQLKKLDGDVLTQHLKQGAPDFYIRNGNKIYLFEFKDILFNAEFKHSKSLDEIIKELEYKMVRSEDDSPKGVSQLINSIKNIEQGKYTFDMLKLSKCVVYPIIVYTDFTFTLSGFNTILNNKMQELLVQEGVHLNVKNLVLIDLNSLIKFQDLIHDKRINFFELIESYINISQKKNAKSLDSLLNSYDSFNLLLLKKAGSFLYNSPRIFNEFIKKIVPNGI